MGEGPTSGGAEASREIEEQLGLKNRREERDHKNKDKNKEKEKELDEGRLCLVIYYLLNVLLLEIVKVYDGYNSLRKRLFRTVTVPVTASKDDLLHASMKAFVVTQVDLHIEVE